MKNTFRLLVVTAMAAVALTARAQDAVKITGYQPGDFAIKGTIPQQLTAKVVAPIESALERSPNSELTVTVLGYADKTGSDAANAQVGLYRAEGVKNYLLAKFPKATFICYSRGDEANMRMATVSWTITAMPLPPQLKKPNQKVAKITIVGIGTLMVVVVAFLFFKKRGDEPQSTQRTVSESLAPTEPIAPAPKLAAEMEIDRDGTIYEVRIFKIEQDGKVLFVTPLPKPNDSRATLHDAKKAVKNGMKKYDAQKFIYGTTDTQVHALVALGEITVKKEK